jgi:oligoendopeptidase F
MPTYSLSRWSLGDLFPSIDGPELRKALSDLDRRTAAFEKHRKQLSPRVATGVFLSWIRELEDIQTTARRLMAYAELHFSEDTQDPKVQAFLSSIQQHLTGLENRLLFFSLWWKGLPPSAAKRLLGSAGSYRYFLEEMLRFRPHTLTESEEKIVNIKNSTGAQALGTLYQTITNRYQFDLEVHGEKKSLTRGELMVYTRSDDANLRAEAYRSLYRVYEKDGPILGQIYSALVRDWHNENNGLRKFATPIAARNLANDLPDRIVRTLLDVCAQNTAVFQKYFALKAARLGLSRLRRYDLYAPVATSKKKYDFAQAWRLVRESFAQFDPELAGLAERVLLQNHLDSEVRPGKRDGAFCLSAVPQLTPWVLTNFQGEVYDLATLAHELGHAVHSLLAAGNPVFTFQASLPLAETASTFAEMLLVDRLLAEECDEAVRRDLLFRQMDDAYATIGRQAFFALFEIAAHDCVRKGGSSDDLCALYRENLAQQFGDSIEISGEFRWEWASIPHIYEMPFYVYAYAFGQLLVLALYSQYRSEGAAFLPRYRAILAAGGSASPARILRRAGIRIERMEFWQGGFDLLSQRVDQLSEG